MMERIRQIVDVPRDHFLTGAGFPLDEDRRFCRRNGLCETQDLQPALAGPDGTRRVGALAPADLLLQRFVLDTELAMLGRALENRHQLVVSERLLDIVERALVHGLHCRLQRCLRGHEDHGTIRIALLGRGEDLDAGHVRHANVREDDVRGGRREILQAAFATLGEVRREAFVP